MPVFITPGQKIKKPRKPTIKGRPVKPAKSAAVAYERQLTEQAKEMFDLPAEIASSIGSGRMKEYEALQLLDLRHEEMARAFGQRSTVLAETFVARVSAVQKRRLEAVLSKSFGVDVLNIIQTEGIEKVFNAGIKENVDLIKTIPDEYFSEIEKAVKDNFAGRPLPEERTLIQQIQAIGGDTRSRAKLIARDQTSKLNSTFNEARQASVGIKKYIWQTSEDARVVGAPGGLYPEGNEAHMNHFSRNGKVFLWSKPPPDGHPGQPIQCRCIAIPLLDRDGLDVIQ